MSLTEQRDSREPAECPRGQHDSATILTAEVKCPAGTLTAVTQSGPEAVHITQAKFFSQRPFPRGKFTSDVSDSKLEIPAGLHCNFILIQGSFLKPQF